MPIRSALRHLLTSLNPLVLLLVAAPFASAGPAAAADDRTDDQCVECHGDKKLLAETDKKKRRLYIDQEVFGATSHGESGCSACHTAVTTDHPKEEQKVEKPDCSTCHEETADEYGKGTHADDSTCTECHNPHQVKTPDVLTSLQMNLMCTKCHDDEELTSKHSPWLPQLDYHLAALPCIACHTGSEDYVITMYIEHTAAGPLGKPLTRAELELLRPSGKDVSAIVDYNEDEKITLDELRRFNRLGRGKGLRLQAMMVPDKVTHSYAIQKNRYDCTFCHAKGPDKKQKAFVVFPEEGDRTYDRVEVQQGAILDLLYGTPDFYMVGASATRAGWMNLAGLGLVACGFLFAGGHSLFRVLTRGRRRAGRKG